MTSLESLTSTPTLHVEIREPEPVAGCLSLVLYGSLISYLAFKKLRSMHRDMREEQITNRELRKAVSAHPRHTIDLEIAYGLARDRVQQEKRVLSPDEYIDTLNTYRDEFLSERGVRLTSSLQANSGSQSVVR